MKFSKTLLFVIASLFFIKISYSCESRIEKAYGYTARIFICPGVIEGHSYDKNNHPMILKPIVSHPDDKFPLKEYVSDARIKINGSGKFKAVRLFLSIVNHRDFDGSFNYDVDLYLNYDDKYSHRSKIKFKNDNKFYCVISGRLIHLKNGKYRIAMDYNSPDSCGFKLVIGDDNNSLALYVKDDVKNIPVTIYMGDLLSYGSHKLAPDVGENIT